MWYKLVPQTAMRESCSSPNEWLSASGIFRTIDTQLSTELPMSRLVELRTLEQELVKQLAQLAALPESRKLRS